jgi:hypothetical protein
VKALEILYSAYETIDQVLLRHLSFEITDEPEVLKRVKEVRGIASLVANAHGETFSRLDLFRESKSWRQIHGVLP